MSLYPELTASEKADLKEGRCPDCGCDDRWQEGPHAAACVNWRCGSCGSRFNAGPLMIERISEPRDGALLPAPAVLCEKHP